MRLTTLCLASCHPSQLPKSGSVSPSKTSPSPRKGFSCSQNREKLSPLQQLCYDDHGYYTTCHLSLKKSTQLLYQGVSPQMITFLSQLLTDPATWDGLCLAIETDISLGDTDNWEGSARVEVGDSDSRVSFVIEGDISHSSGGTDGSVNSEIEVGF